MYEEDSIYAELVMNEEETGSCLSLTWDEYGATYQQMLNNLRNQNSFTDVTLACENQKFLAHKLVLVTCSDFFKSILQDVRCEHPIIFLRGIDATEMQILIEFMYIGKINIQNDKLNSLMETAKVLRIKGLGSDKYNQSVNVPIKRRRTDHDDKTYRLNTPNKSSSRPAISTSNYQQTLVDQNHSYSLNIGDHQENKHHLQHRKGNKDTSLMKRSSHNDISLNKEDGSILSSLLNSSQPPMISSNYEFQTSESMKQINDCSSSHPMQRFNRPPSSTYPPTELCSLTEHENRTRDAVHEQHSVKEEPLDCSQGSNVERDANFPPSNDRLLEETNPKDNLPSPIEIIFKPLQDENTETADRPYVCPICKKNFAKAAILKRHHLAHFRPYACKLCERSFTRREVLTEHVLEHNGADLRLPCPVCNMTIKRKRNLQAHIKVKHPEYHQQKKADKLGQVG